MPAHDEQAPLVFISYSRSDAKVAHRLSATLSNKGIPTWLDTEELSPGTNFGIEIEKVIHRADAIIVVVSTSSLESNWMRREMELSLQSTRPVLLAVIDKQAANRLPSFALLQSPWFDLTKTNFTEGVERLVEQLGRFLDLQSGSILPRPEVQSKGYVFLSYAEEDFDFVGKLADFLENRGYGYWGYASSDRDYQGQMHLELEDVIRDAAATFSILTPDWKRSDWTVREYMYSKEVGTPVFLLKLRDMGPTLIVAGTPYIDFSLREAEGFDRLGRLLDRKGLLK